MAEATPILRDTLLAALRTLPGTRKFHIHVLQSSPRRNTSLFQFAKPRPRTYVQDVLVLLSEQLGQDAPRVLVTAIEGNLYHVPSTSSAILYVCKVDSTGQTNGTSPTRALVRAFLNYYANPATRPVDARNLWIQLFARAQGQYLFPNSAQFEGKRPLSDVKLCAWWKRVLSQAALDVVDAISLNTPNSPVSSSSTAVQAYYILPGYGQLEAEYSLKVVSPDVTWEYGHPYTMQQSLPCALDTQFRNLGHYIPYFDDDPKSRFLDEIAYTTGGEVKSPVRKRARTATSVEDARQRDNVDDKDSGKEKDDRPLGELGKVTPDEFWERMSFRQECVAGAVTGFFTLDIEGEGQSKPQPQHVAPSPLEPQPGQVSSQINKRVLTALTTGVEFSTAERAIKATETLESTIKRLCEGISTIPNTSRSHSSGRSSTPEPRERSNLTLLVPPSTPPRNIKRAALPDVTPNPFPEPVASLETYQSHIYGSVCVSNPIPEATPQGGGKGDDKESSEVVAPVVTVLTARKKKKRAE
ncbi:hypothetical protein P691DRAFT_794586 [Macrolepiota fuliginosa MF-IS2]|uniref:histone acetyltransferase n=1 Tax=Macrolepiota fuliginosa MF-IS2 TaxID=1400762 RepID=A0A9P5XNQ3_9AGAR|nr:hypothetical protein P691DRAFT_794586 [Macrolepiota fuliginosa MF-IS2]